ncbi:TonB-dependent receptor [Pseudorhodoferax aquiterrae]|uniref:TonB-dependent receptor n=1 Tax=Pseudorhodoferax aquiterrae TaxID=747304 RepID=A0ABQ3G5G9_9BURK|nr:TonB-dependent receptor [Pseudorhodoferax aquiterrae]
MPGQAQTDAPALAATVVTATRTEADPQDVPASIGSVAGDDLRQGRAQVNISEALGSVPGLQARERQNYAQDVQISMRGFGTRATFGIRGLRLYVDGIPATQPDGQGQLSHVDLASAERIEVLRGPFSALYGNSSGGVLQVFTEEGRGAPRLRLDTAAGSDGLLRFGTKLSGNTGPNDSGVGYVLSASRFATDGYREHSAARRTLANAKLTLRPHEDGKLTLVANRVVLPKAEDPLGLERKDWQANPRGVAAAATNYNTRKSMDQTQAGLVYEHYLSEAHSVQGTLYGGQRSTQQFQSIPRNTQVSLPLHPGGVIDLDRDYAGADLRWTWHTRLADAPLTVVAGLAYDGLREDRRGYENFVGSALGVQGALRRDEHNRVNNFDQYLQADWRVTQRWTLNAGLRHSRIRVDSQDRYITAANPDDSGVARYGATLPVVGASFAITESLRIYASAGKGFETPTLNELSYRPDQLPGLNFGLNPARSKSVETGLKHRSAAFGEWTVAVFRTGTEDEIVTRTIDGRATATNAGRTRRNGLELSWEQRFLQHLRMQMAATLLDARYRDGANAGSRMPGLAKSSLYASAGWMPQQGWRAGADWRVLSKVYVNDANNDAAAGYGVLGLYTGYLARVGSWQLEGFVRADNLLDKRYAGSVIVNDATMPVGRYFEPAPGRNWLVGLSATLAL